MERPKLSELNTQIKGDLAELRVAAAIRRLGYTVLLPFTESQKYDIVADTGDEFVAIQVKYASLKDGKLRVSCYCSNSSKSGDNSTFYTADEIDGIAAFSEELKQCFWIPYEDLNRYTFTLSEDGPHPFEDYQFSNL